MSGFPTHHGGRLTDAVAQFGGRPSDWLDLSTGINPVPWQPCVDLRPDWRALPDPSALGELEHVAAVAIGTHRSFCAAVPGSEAGLRALAHLLRLPGRHADLCYSTHAQAFEAASGAGASVLVLANPNNPDGALLTRDALQVHLAHQERSGGWLIVDEAFVDCMPEWSVADLVGEDRRLIVTRSFGKFFGLAGVRLGFVVAPTPLLTRLRHLMGEWPVCTAALDFGRGAYADTAWIAETRARLPQASARLDRVLLRHGLTPVGHCPLFRLVETPSAPQLFEALARQHILTRPFDGHPGLLRFGLPSGDDALARLDTALGSSLAHG